MRGFADRSTVSAALQWIDSTVRSVSEAPSIEYVTPFEASGRVLAGDIVSDLNVPGFARSMMDGFAVRSDETHGATAYNPLLLKVIGQSLPGRAFQGQLLPGEAVRIMTGAPMPEGADAVLPVEQTEISGDQVLIEGSVSSGKHVGQIGEDIPQGDPVLSAGRTLRPQDAGILSSIGVGRIPVIRRPMVRVLMTGNELLPAGTRPAGYQIADANGPMLSGLVARDGGQIVSQDTVTDQPDVILKALQQPADVVLVSGGSSVGQEDHVPVILSQQGELAVHGVAMRPSSPAGFGRLGRTLVFLLPGNPVSCLCAYDFFAGRAIRLLGHRRADWPYRLLQATLNRKLVSTVGRLDYARVRIEGTVAEPLAISGASVLSSTTRADGFVVVPEDSEGYPPGTIVDVFLY